MEILSMKTQGMMFMAKLNNNKKKKIKKSRRKRWRKNRRENSNPKP